MQRILLVLLTLASFSSVAGAGWDVEFTFESALPAPHTEEPVTASDSGNPLSIHWNIRGVEEVANDARIPRSYFVIESARDVSTHSYFVASTRLVPRRDSEADSDLVRFTAGTWPLMPRSNEKSAHADLQDPIVNSLWPLTRRLFWPELLRC